MHLSPKRIYAYKRAQRRRRRVPRLLTNVGYTPPAHRKPRRPKPCLPTTVMKSNGMEAWARRP